MSRTWQYELLSYYYSKTGAGTAEDTDGVLYYAGTFLLCLVTTKPNVPVTYNTSLFIHMPVKGLDVAW